MDSRIGTFLPQRTSAFLKVFVDRSERPKGGRRYKTANKVGSQSEADAIYAQETTVS